MTVEAQIQIEDERQAPTLFGANDRNLRLIRETYGVKLVARSGLIKLQGEQASVDAARDAVERLKQAVRNGGTLTGEKARSIVLEGAPAGASPTLLGGAAPASIRDKLRPKSAGQERYVRAMDDHDLVFSIGPAGTGKTYLAVAMAVAALKTGRVRRIVLVRPAVEAGEKLGFLPGDFQAKINPYLRPLYDALGLVLPGPEINRLAEKDQIEIVPLAYMRGRTLQDAFIIMDEAQNTTPRQMKMFLTRLGLRSRIVVTGDVTQIDLAVGQASGLVNAQNVLGKVKDIAFVYLTKEDIVRHPLVADIVDAYESSEELPATEPLDVDPDRD